MSNSRVKANEVERWSGSLRDAAVWSRRFMGDADACRWSDILEGLEIYTPSDPAHRDQAAINAITDEAARRAAQLIFTNCSVSMICVSTNHHPQQQHGSQVDI